MSVATLIELNNFLTAKADLANANSKPFYARMLLDAANWCLCMVLWLGRSDLMQ